jgi:transcriptional regulator with XRE-family HTH domain
LIDRPSTNVRGNNVTGAGPRDDAAAIMVSMNAPKTAAAWISELRTKHGLTQEQFAELVGVDRVTVANWERGAREPDFGSVQAIVGKCPDAGALLAGEPSPPSADPEVKTPEAREVAYVLDKLNLEARIYVRDMIYRVIGRPRLT